MFNSFVGVSFLGLGFIYYIGIGYCWLNGGMAFLRIVYIKTDRGLDDRGGGFVVE